MSRKEWINDREYVIHDELTNDGAAPEWPQPPAHIYPHRYARCVGCGDVVRDFQGDAVWRDVDGGTLCDDGGRTSHGVAYPWNKDAQSVRVHRGGPDGWPYA